MRLATAGTSAAALALVLASVAQPAFAVGVDFTWDDGGADNDLSTIENWAPDVAPGLDDNLFFPVGNDATQDLAFPNIRSLNFSSTESFSLGGAAFDLTEDIHVDQTAGTSVSITAPFDFAGATGDIEVAADNTLALNDVTFDGLVTVSGAGTTNVLGPFDGTGTVTKSGTGALVIVGDGNVDTVVVNDGVLYWDGVSADTDVIVNGGYLVGGAPANIGNFQLLGTVGMTDGRISGGTTLLGSDPGSMYLAGSFTGSETAVYQVDLEGTVVDVIDVAGVFTPNDIELELYPGTLPAVGTELTIARAGGDITAGSFFTHATAGELSDGEVFVADGQYFSIDYRTVTVVLTYLGDTAPAEEPVLPATGTEATQPALVVLGLLLVGVLLVLASRRRVALR